MRVTVRLFARLRELVGVAELVREVPPGATVGSLWESLTAEFPDLAPYTGSVSTAVNAEYVKADTALRGGDEVAFLPPVSGGAPGPHLGPTRARRRERRGDRRWSRALGAVAEG